MIVAGEVVELVGGEEVVLEQVFWEVGVGSALDAAHEGSEGCCEMLEIRLEEFFGDGCFYIFSIGWLDKQSTCRLL